MNRLCPCLWNLTLNLDHMRELVSKTLEGKILETWNQFSKFASVFHGHHFMLYAIVCLVSVAYNIVLSLQCVDNGMS